MPDNEALEYAIKLLALKDRTEMEIRKSLLSKGFQTDMINRCIQELKSQGIINDERFCQRYVSKKKQATGRYRLLAELKSKGIDADMAEAAVADIDDEAEFDKAYEICLKKFAHLNREQDAKLKRKIAGWLERRGFSSAVIIKVLGCMFNDDY